MFRCYGSHAFVVDQHGIGGCRQVCRSEGLRCVCVCVCACVHVCVYLDKRKKLIHFQSGQCPICEHWFGNRGGFGYLQMSLLLRVVDPAEKTC